MSVDTTLAAPASDIVNTLSYIASPHEAEEVKRTALIEPTRELTVATNTLSQMEIKVSAAFARSSPASHFISPPSV